MSNPSGNVDEAVDSGRTSKPADYPLIILRKKRTALRTSVTKHLKLIENEIKKADTDISALEETIELLLEKAESLRITDNELEKHLDPEDFDEENDKVEEYREKITIWKHRANKRIKEKKDQLAGTSRISDILNGSEPQVSSVAMIPKESPKVKLPKFSIATFYGDSSQWLNFWSSFESSIHNNEALNKVDKFNYLKGYLGGTAASTVEGFSLSAENYDSVINLLKDRFGRRDMLINAHMNNLLSIPPLKSSNDLNGFRKLFDKIQTQIRSLEALDVVSNSYGALLCPMLLKLLPQELVFDFNRSQKFDAEFSITDLLDFLLKELSSRERARDTLALTVPLKESRISHSFSRTGTAMRHDRQTDLRPEKTKIASAAELVCSDIKENRCTFCELPHDGDNCEHAKSLSLTERKNLLKLKGGCFRCLKRGHISRNCKAKIKCSKCASSRHCSSMCQAKEVSVWTSEQAKETSCVLANGNECNTNRSCMSSVLLQTLVVKLHGEKESFVRVLIDTGSQRSYISKFAAKNCELKSIGQEEVIHSLFGGIEKREKHSRHLAKVSDMRGGYICSFQVLDQTKICSHVPRIKYGEYARELKDHKVFITDMENKRVKLLFENSPEEVHMLIGSDVAGKLFTGKVKQLGCGLSCVQTRLGWTIMGKVNPETVRDEDSLSVLSLSLHVSDSNLAELWRLDTLGILDPNETKNDALRLQEEAKTHFLNTVSRSEDGRYEVSLPWILDSSILPSNRKLAERCLDKTEKKLVISGRKDDYLKVFREWEANDIIERVNDQEGERTHYLPHRPIFKESSETTKIRPVFNASARSANSPSLNDCLTKGSNLVEILPRILNRFRKFQIAVSSDIEKAFLQIALREEDRDFLRFLIYDEGNNLKIFRHKRVVFGVTSSPFLLAATLNYHLDQVPENLSDVVETLRDSFYVDNSLISLDTEKETERFVKESQKIMLSGQFNLRCWRSNSPRVVSEEKEPGEDNVSVLGMIWNTRNDTLTLNVENSPEEIERLTKRKLLSLTQKVFDPIGISAPVTLIPKMMLQETWILGIKWDEELPPPLTKKFTKWFNQLHFLSLLHVPRWLNVRGGNEDKVAIHVFCDASKNAYATCVFVRVETESGIKVQLASARSRVAPIKPMTIPRLELLACLIGARLSSTILLDLKLPNVATNFWTDSTTALAWIHRGEQWGTFVHNRVKEIKTLSAPSNWRHIHGKFNPADLPSRGCASEQLLRSRWWEGPSWLFLPEAEWPQSNEKPNEELVSTEKRKKILILHNEEKSDWYYRYFSSYSKMVRMIAWIMRFYRLAKRLDTNDTPELSVLEIDNAEKAIIRLVQKDSFSGKTDRSIASLRPCQDKDGILRTKTCVVSRDDTEYFRYPVILPSDHPVVHRMIEEEHRKLHSGVTELMATLREKFWIVKSRKTIRHVVRGCVRCRRFDGRKSEAEPGLPPEDRVRDALVFEVVGVDLAGPLHLKDGRKSWIVLFTCAVYRAIHLELVTSLSTEAFLQALRRFICRRGKPHTIYSDNGTNFVGTDRAFDDIDWDTVFAVAATQKIRWKFSPPSAAWWGGWWERLIQMVKKLLRKNLGRASLDYEEMITMLCDCERTVNSRPLTYLSEDVQDPTPLTPAIFLHELPQSGVPDIDEVDRKQLTRRAKYRQKIRDILRERFRKEYLGQLRHPPLKSRSRDRPVKIGDLVLIEEATKHRIDWPLAKVTKTIPGKDGVTRLVEIKTEKGVFLRPVQRIYQLEISEEEIFSRDSEAVPMVLTRARRIVDPSNMLRS